MTAGESEVAEADPGAPGSGLVGGVIPPRLWKLVDRIETGLALLDQEGRVLAANEAGRALLSLGTGDGSPQFFGRAASFEGSDALGERYRSGVSNGDLDLETVAELELPEGDRTFSIRILAAPAPPGVPPRGLVMLRDRTELVTERRRRKRAESLAAVEELAAGMAHEVNNPLSSIKAFAQIVKDETEEDDEKQKLLELILKEVDRVANLIGRNMNLVRDPTEEAHRGPVDLNELVREVLDLRGYSLESLDIDVQCDLSQDLPPVQGSEDDLRQVLVNLLVNAEEALAEVQQGRNLIVRTRASSAGVLLAVVDDGPGIPSDRLPDIFEPFHTTKEDGTGLGLQICRSIVREHDGEMWVESEEGEGAAFWVRLRRTPSRQQPERPDDRAEVRQPPRGERVVGADEVQPATRKNGKRAPSRRLDILVVDDEELVRRALKISLEKRGHRVALAEDAHVGRERAQGGEFDVAILDARMPGDGLRLRQELEERHDMRGRTLLLTGDVGRQETREALEDGPCVNKPFDFEEVAQRVEELAESG